MKSFCKTFLAALFCLSRMDLQSSLAQAPVVVPPPSYAKNRPVETTLAIEFRPCDSKESQLLKIKLTTTVQAITPKGEIVLRHSVQSQGVSGSTYALRLDKRGTPLSGQGRIRRTGRAGRESADLRDASTASPQTRGSIGQSVDNPNAKPAECLLAYSCRHQVHGQQNHAWASCV